MQTPRSRPQPSSQTTYIEGRSPGFRYFPGFYRHLPDTMRRIPAGGHADGVAGNLVGSTRALMAQAHGRNETLAVDVSEWERPSARTGKVAMKSTAQEISAEVWAQLKDHLDDGTLRDSNVVASFLDPAVPIPNPTSATNLEPLLVNTAGSWQDRPDAATQIPNLYLASDFVRTHTDLATMEGANELPGARSTRSSSARPRVRRAAGYGR